jgi:uncharacterized membrane protein
MSRSDDQSAAHEGLDRLKEPRLASVVERNIRSIEEHHRAAEGARTIREKIADFITGVSGSLGFVWLHVLWFGLWIALNVGLLGIPSFDPFPFGLLTTIVSLEAIFLSTFVLVSQNRQSVIADQRAQLDLQINLLAERELTRILQLQDAIARHLGVHNLDAMELQELEEDVQPEVVLQQLDAENGRKGRPVSDGGRDQNTRQ